MTQSFDEFKKYHNANYHDGDDTFDHLTYLKLDNGDFSSSFVQDCFDHFNAGQQSRQAEIDELQAKYDGLNNRASGLAWDQMNTAQLNYELQKRIDRALERSGHAL